MAELHSIIHFDVNKTIAYIDSAKGDTAFSSTFTVFLDHVYIGNRSIKELVEDSATLEINSEYNSLNINTYKQKLLDFFNKKIENIKKANNPLTVANQQEINKYRQEINYVKNLQTILNKNTYIDEAKKDDIKNKKKKKKNIYESLARSNNITNISDKFNNIFPVVIRLINNHTINNDRISSESFIYTNNITVQYLDYNELNKYFVTDENISENISLLELFLKLYEKIDNRESFITSFLNFNKPNNSLVCFRTFGIDFNILTEHIKKITNSIVSVPIYRILLRNFDNPIYANLNLQFQSTTVNSEPILIRYETPPEYEYEYENNNNTPIIEYEYALNEDGEYKINEDGNREIISQNYKKKKIK